MTLEERLQLVNRVETEFDTAKLKCDGLAIWAVVRLWIFDNAVVQQGGTVAKAALKKQGALGEIRFFAKLLFDSALAGAKSPRMATTRPTDMVFVADAEKRNELVEGRYFHKFADATRFYAGAHRSFHVMEFSQNGVFHAPKFNAAQSIDFEVHKVLFEEKIRAFFRNRQPQKNIEGFEEFENFLKTKDLRHLIRIKAQDIRRSVHLIQAYRRTFARLLRPLRPKAVFLICFYSKINMGLTLACNDLKIKSVEMQHGIQGEHHLMYASWKNAPPEGWALLPTHFWAWSEDDAAILRRWAGATQRHKVLVGGNTWLAYYRQVVNNQPQAAVLQNDNTVRVLVSLQFIETFEQSCLAQAIRCSPAHYRWYLRLHPRFLHELGRVQDFLLNEKCAEKVDLEVANSWALFDLFKLMQYHVTYWSTTALEALAFGVPTVLLHADGAKIMKKQIDSGVFRYTESAETLLNILATNDFEVGKHTHIVTDPFWVQNAIKNLVDEE